MKANEAPEKIILSADRDTQIIQDEWVIGDYTDNIKIEYIRTDAFIDRAVDWLKNFYNEDTHSYLIDEDIEKFINYMKGE